MQLSLNLRQQQMLEMIKAEGEVKVSELKTLFDVTEMTIRRDLEKMEQIGAARRTYGGAISITQDVALHERTGVMTEEKKRIGRKAADLVQSGESVFIDGGSTTMQVARYLKSGSNITVVTNALNLAGELMKKNIETIVIGGTLVEATSSLVGPIAIDTICKMAFDRVFLGTTGLTAQHGFSNSNVYEAELKKAAIQQATEVNMVLDHSKFGAKELISFAGLGQTHRILTDLMPDSKLNQACKKAGVEIVEC